MDICCRLCLRMALDYESISEFKNGVPIRQIIEKICSIHVEDEENICGFCLRILIESYELRLLAIKNDEYLRRQRKDDEELIVYEEEIVQFDPGSENEEYLDENILQSIEIHDNKLICDFCNQTFTNKKEIMNHMTTKHIHTTNLTCKECQINFKTVKRFEMHASIHSQFKITIDKNQKTFECRSCHRVFEEESKVKEHIYYHKNYKTSTSSSSEALICPYCGHNYKSRQILMQHIKRHVEPEKYQCEKCPLKFKTWNELYYHKSVHTTERNFICSISNCGKAFKAKRDLRNHTKRHETKDVKNFECEHCQLKLKSKFSLDRHILTTHVGLKQHACTHCKKSFAQKTELNKHLRTHIGVNTYNCKNCNLSFRLISDLRRHEEIHFGAALE